MERDYICELVGECHVDEELDNKRDQSYEIFKYTALLAAKGIDFADILHYMGYTEIYVYGAGEIGQMFLSVIDGKINVKNVIDKNNIMYSDIMDNDLPIIITPAGYYQEVSYAMIKNGIRRKRIHSIHTLLTVAMKYLTEDELMSEGSDKKSCYTNRKHFLITGAQFTNKGAQSMLFVAVSEIRKRFKDAIIWFLPVDGGIYTKVIKNKYDFLFLTDGYDIKAQVYEILTELTAVVDVSGYELSSLWEQEHFEWYMRVLRFAYRYDVPLYLMPQSFGPFDFSEKKQNELRLYLSSARHIFAREQTAYKQMKEIYGLSNISLSRDLVLQNKGIEEQYIYCTSADNCKIGDLNTTNNVAIVPNGRMYEFCAKDKVIDLYTYLVEILLELDKRVYLISHSGEGDKKVCCEIKECFADCDMVHVIEEDMDCVEFEEFADNFQYMIASRFHSIVHGYKQGVPCVAVGWADKYKELLAAFCQEKYVFDVREDIDRDIIKCAVINMNSSYDNESDIIRGILPSIQKENCFDVLSELY